jgi:hypothetical protein
MKKNKIIKWSIVLVFISLYIITSIVSTIHVIDFFRLSNPNWLAISIAIAFEIGAAASLASIIVMDKMNKFIVWSLFFILTAMQAIGNTYFAYTHLSDFSQWSELFGLSEEEPVFQKRILSVISGAILPLVSLGFIKALVDYIRPDSTKEKTEEKIGEIQGEEKIEEFTESIESKEEEIGEEKIENIDNTNKSRRLKDTVYYDLDPTKIT